MRKTKEELNAIQQKYNVPKLWSFSQINKYSTSHFEYFLRYVLHVKEDKHDGIYAESGGSVHNILEDFYTKQISYEDMITRYDDALFLFEQSELKYNKTDEEKNTRIANKYEDSVKHFLTHHIVFDRKVRTEQFVTIKVPNINPNANIPYYIFQGYIDFAFKDDDDNYCILDWKTSTKYTGAKADKEGKQLRLYAEALHQLGVPYDKIKCAWDFLKYTTVSYLQVNGKEKVRDIVRAEIGASLVTVVKTKMKKAGYSAEKIDNDCKLMVEMNTLDFLPEEIKNEFTFSDCIVELSISEEIIDDLNRELSTIINEINSKIDDTKVLSDETKDFSEFFNEISESKQKQIEDIWWDSEELLKVNEYYMFNLCGYSRELHKPWNKYLKKIEQASLDKENIYSNIGKDLDNSQENNYNNNKEIDENDLSWLDNI